MSITPEQYVMRLKYVEAIQVTSKNINDVALWCGGNVLPNPVDGKPFIDVPVNNPRVPRHKNAVIGDYIVKDTQGFKVYAAKAFKGLFDRPSEKMPTGVMDANPSRNVFENSAPGFSDEQ